MQGFKFTVNYLVFTVCFFSLGAFGQTTDRQDSLRFSNVDTLQSVYKDTIQKKNSKQVDEIISFAKTFLGTPYRYAGSTPSGFDCSGFISYVFGNFGLNLVHSSYGMAEFGETVRIADIQPGDLMFFKGSNLNSTRVGHVAMVIEVTPNAIKFIHSSTSRGVVIDNFKTSKYFIPRFIKAKRLDYGQGSK
jgi:cell wall-associated NlpC family hydrolase